MNGLEEKLMKSRQKALKALVGLLILVLTCITLPFQTYGACYSEDYVYPGKTWERITDFKAAGYDKKKLEAVTEYVKTLKTTGLLVTAGGKVLYEYGDLEQLSYLASVRKSILAMLYGNYVANGTIDLNKTLKELGMTDIGGLLPIEEKATIEHLISARSGIYHPASNAGDSTASAPPRGSQEPGTYFLYNNWDFNAAGAVFEQLTGKDIYDALEEDLAKPIEMQDFDRSRQRKSGDMKKSKYPAYHMWLSTRDMARIGYLMLREGKWKDIQVIPRNWTKKIVSIRTPLDAMNPKALRQGRLAYGYMWWLWSGPKVTPPYEGAYSGRGAYGQYITVLPALDMAIAHKTAVPPQKNVNMIQYAKIIDLIIEARIE
jgi:CubicO group peptidase (beta-lactamase class C family)